MFNSTILNLSNHTDYLEDDQSWFMPIIEHTSYFFYTIIFIVGLTGNSIVIYVLLSSVCFSTRSSQLNNPNPCYQQQDTPQSVKKNSFKNKKLANVSFKADFPKEENETNVIKTEKKMVKYSDSIMVSSEPSTIIPNDNLSDLNDSNSTKIYSLVSSTQNQRQSWLNGRNEATNYRSELYSVNNSSMLIISSQTKLKQFRSIVMRFLKEKLSVTNFYLLNLAITDFSYLISIPFLLITIKSKNWIFGEFFCKIYLSLCYLCQCSSVFILVVLSVDRYLSVKYPHKVALFRSSEIARIVMLISWCLSFIFITPVVIYTELNLTNNTHDCGIKWPGQWNFVNLTDTERFINDYLTPLHAFTIYTFLFNYLIPVSTIVILYLQILRRLHRKSKVRKSKSKTKSNRKITRMVLTIIVCYIICWSPYWFSQIFNYVYQEIFKRENSIFLVFVSHFVQIIAYLSSALNPFIYSYMSEAFKANLKLTFQNCCFLRREECSSQSNSIKRKKTKGLTDISKVKKKTNDLLKNDLSCYEETIGNDFHQNENMETVHLANNLAQETNTNKTIESIKFFEKRDNKTFFYKTKSNFAFEINFHPINIKDKLFLRKINIKSKLRTNQEQLYPHIATQLHANNITTNSCKQQLLKENSKHNFNDNYIKDLDAAADNDNVFDHESIINYFK